MASHRQSSRRRCSVRIMFIVVGLLFIGLATIWVLGIVNLVPKPWSEIMAAIFAVIGVVLPISGWFWSEVKKPELATLVIHTTNVLRGASVTLYEGFLPLGEIALSPPICSASNILSDLTKGYIEFMAVFRFLKPGQYTAYLCHNSCIYHTFITVLPGRIVEIDWR